MAGWLLAHFLAQALLGLLGPQSAGLVGQVRPDATIFAFSAAATLAAGVLFGILPAWRAAHADPMPAIHGSASGSGGRWRLSRFIVAGQVALSLALLFCAGLFAQTLRNLRSIDLGFPPENLVLLHVDLGRTVYRDHGAETFFEDLLRRTRDLLSTRAASLASVSVLSGSMQSIMLQIPGYVSPNHLSPVTYFTAVSSGYFRTLGLPLFAGRDFTDSERESGEGGVIVNEEFAREFFAGDALGKTFSYGGGRKVRIVGIAGTAKFRWVKEDPHPVMYVPVTPQHFPQALFLQVRTTGDPAGAIERLRALLHNLDSRVPVDSITTMQMQIDEALARERLLAFLSTLLALITVALASIGLYGVLSFSVARRMREISIRMAVGAERRQILMLFLDEGARVVLGGIAIGVPFAFVSGRLASSLLYGLKPQDTATAVMAAAVLALVALAAHRDSRLACFAPRSHSDAQARIEAGDADALHCESASTSLEIVTGHPVFAAPVFHQYQKQSLGRCGGAGPLPRSRRQKCAEAFRIQIAFAGFEQRAHDVADHMLEESAARHAVEQVISSGLETRREDRPYRGFQFAVVGRGKRSTIV